MLRSRLCYICLLIGAICLCLFFSSPASLAATLLLCGILTILFVITIISACLLKIELSEQTNILERNMEQERILTIKNNSIFPISHLKLKYNVRNQYEAKDISQTLLLSVPPRASLPISLGLQSRHCGKLFVYIKFAICYDALGVSSFHKRLSLNESLYVMPEASLLTPLSTEALPDDAGSLYSTKIKGEDYAQTFDYHVYREGDKIKHIHWKLSSKLDTLMVKEGSLPLSARLCILLDPAVTVCHAGSRSEKGHSRSAPEIMDKLLTAAAAVTEQLTALQTPHDVGFYCEEDGCVRFVSIGGDEDFEFALASLYDTPISSLPLVLNEIDETPPLIQYAKIIYITSELNEDDRLKKLEKLAKSSAITLLSPENAQLREQAEGLNIEFIGL